MYSSNLHSSSGHTFNNNILVQYKLICITKAGMLGYIKGPNEDVRLRLIRKSEDYGELWSSVPMKSSTVTTSEYFSVNLQTEYSN